jgi:C-terminal processing protease CtpA/Prc
MFLDTRYTMDPIGNSEQIPQTYTLKRRASYDGLGILVSADSQTRLNHFIREVEPSSPGYRAGLRKNDRIISINGVYVENVDFSNVLLLIKQGLDNDNLQLTVIHEPEHI